MDRKGLNISEYKSAELNKILAQMIKVTEKSGIDILSPPEMLYNDG